MRRISAKIHLWLSVPLGLVISIICLTGAALVFENEITERAQADLYRVNRPEGAQPLPVDALVARVATQMPDSLQPTSLQIVSDPDAAWLMGCKGMGKRMLSVNPYTGSVNGQTQSLPFFQTMRKMHRWLMDPPPHKGAKSAGKTIVGITTLLMVIILITGLIIWVPRNRKGIRPRLSVSPRKGWPRFWFDNHVSLGFYATIFLLIMALTGLTWSFGWYRTGFYALFGVSTQRQPKPAEKHKENRQHPAPDFQAWEKAVAAVRQQYPDFGTLRVSDGTIQVLPKGARNGDRVQFDRATGSLHSVKPYAEIPMSGRMKGLVYSLHTGLWGGMTTRILYFAAALLGGILPLTGYYLWLRRIVKKHKSTPKK